MSSVIKAKIKELNIKAEVKHLSYSDTESQEFAKSIGLVAGTAKDVAKKINRPIDVDRLDQIFVNNTSIKNSEFKDYNDCNWSYELDEYLRPYELKANEVGILMTPVLIINGVLKHQGSVPQVESIHQWILDLKNKATKV
jgi:hypothetical protein